MAAQAHMFTHHSSSEAPAFTIVTCKELDGTEREVAKVFLDSQHLNDETLAHIRGQSKNATLKHVRIMPDCHVGSGCCVGLTSHLTDRIVPALIGPDIGCGVLTYPLGTLPIQSEKAKLQLDTLIRRLVPVGSGHNNSHPHSVATRWDIENMCSHAQSEANRFVQAYLERFDINLAPWMPVYSQQWFEKKCQTIHANRDLIQRGLGSTGGGNHFIELNVDKNNVHYLTIHSGSRSFGKHICDFHQRRIYNAKTFDEYAFRQAKKQFKQLKKTNRVQYDVAIERLQQEISDVQHPPYLEGEEAYEYFFDMIFAQHYAQLNRDLILRRVHAAIQEWCRDQSTPVEISAYDPDRKIESIHNNIDFRDFIIRKGAIGARKNELCLVALNSRDGILLCRGKGNDDWNQSCAHGCGRIMSREAAKKEIDLQEYITSMDGVFSTSVSVHTKDEAPQAYKDCDMIRRTIAHSVDVVEQLRPVLNIKGS